jgi:hypothetical protein
VRLKLVQVVAIFLLFCFLAPHSSGQARNVPSAVEVPSQALDQSTGKAEAEMAKKANQKRQLDLQRDTEKLVSLANELKQYVDRSNKNILSVDVIRKAEEIEKLAHSVKEKMRGHN